MHFLEIFGQKKCLFEWKTVFLGQEVHYYMVYIAYFTELILQICVFAQKWRIWRENCKYVLDENFHSHFCPRRKAAKFCHPADKTLLLVTQRLSNQQTNFKVRFSLWRWAEKVCKKWVEATRSMLGCTICKPHLSSYPCRLDLQIHTFALLHTAPCTICNFFLSSDPCRLNLQIHTFALLHNLQSSFEFGSISTRFAH